MIDHVWTVVCSRAVIDRESNNVSLQNIIEQINIRGEPIPDRVVAVQLEVVTLWVRADFDVPSQATTRLTVLSPSGNVLGSFESDIDVSEYERFRARVKFEGLLMPELGRYAFRTELKNKGESEWHEVATIPLKIVFVSPEREPEQARE